MKKLLIGCCCLSLIFFAETFDVGLARSQDQEPVQRTVFDMAGRKVVLPHQVNRIYTDGTAMTQLILMLGGLPKLIAVLPSTQSNPWVRKIYPSIANIPASKATGANIEELVRMKPDVVTLWAGNDALQNKLESLGIATVTFNYSDPAELKQGVILMGQILGGKEVAVAREFCTYYDTNIRWVTTKTHSLSRSQKVKAYYVAANPLNTEGRDSMVTSWMGMAGGLNVASEAGIEPMVADVSMEDVIGWNPDVIIIRDAPNLKMILADERWKNINAVKKGRIYINPKGLNVWCARSADSALQPLWAAKIFHPDIFGDIDLRKEVVRFYKQFYHYELNEAELKDVLYPRD
ncbi:MAG TPA: transporter [Firmicutes bacterium]|jgi:iron complex transport system substrate-binding protein|nr:transporter [Bacillota bacterium]